ncbi:MAG: hypothetical protein J7647_05635 [Cyanobacteria bacterium SBLK]|nr:hypothetical protein [Cyanobacteria bacterium SBLK]
MPVPDVLNRLTRVVAFAAAMLILASSLFWNALPASARENSLINPVQQGQITPGSAAEWDTAQTILVHTPRNELFAGILHPEAALFEEPFNTKQAAKEHIQYVQKLKDRDIEVLQVARVLRQNPGTLRDLVTTLGLDDFDCVDMDDSVVEMSFEDSEACEEQKDYFRRNLDTLMTTDPSILVWMVLNQAQIKSLACTDPSDNYANCGEGSYNVVAEYQIDPLMNMYFTRDQMITTANGVVVGKMSDSQRANETKIIEVVLDDLNITPIYTITGDRSVLEGGDFIPAGERVFIGQGARTTYEAIYEMLDAEEDVFGANVQEVVVVKDLWQNQQEMHLDTYFNIASPTTAVLVEDRFPAGIVPGVDCSEVETDDGVVDKCLTADVWERNVDSCSGWTHGEYCLRTDNEYLEFIDVLSDAGFENIIPVSVKNQEDYGINFLTLEEGVIAVVEGSDENPYYPDYLEDLRNAGLTVEEIPFDNLKLGYGAAHCTTQVLSRGES